MEFQKPCVMRFSLKIWACIVLKLNLCWAFWVKIETKSCCTVKSLLTVQVLVKTFTRTLSQVMKLGFMAMMSEQKPSLPTGYQTRHPHPKERGKFGPKQKWCWLCFFLLWGHNSSWISTLWPDGEQGILSEGDKKAGTSTEEKKAWFVKEKKMVAPSWQCCSAFLLSESWFSHKAWDDTHPPASILTRPCTSGLLSIHRAEIHTERITIWVSRRLKKIHWQSYAVFQKRHSGNASKTGRNAGSDV